MGYAHINNLYKEQSILLFRECYALEKIHGTSAHISWNGGQLGFFSGGANYEQFVALFDKDKLAEQFRQIGQEKEITIYGEAYGGKLQGMSATYGKILKFVVFDVKIGGSFVNVPNAHQIAERLGLEFVYYVKIPTDLSIIDKERDAPSIQAERNGCGNDKLREGVVLRPLEEATLNNGQRIICKHKRKEFTERRNQPKVVDPSQLEVLTNAKMIAEEWVVPMRLEHVLAKHIDLTGIEHTGKIIKAMIEDIMREAEGEIVFSKEAISAIGKRTAELWKKQVYNKLYE